MLVPHVCSEMWMKRGWKSFRRYVRDWDIAGLVREPDLPGQLERSWKATVYAIFLASGNGFAFLKLSVLKSEYPGFLFELLQDRSDIVSYFLVLFLHS